jgi:hypothetical protein
MERLPGSNHSYVSLTKMSEAHRCAPSLEQRGEVCEPSIAYIRVLSSLSHGALTFAERIDRNQERITDLER